MKTQKPNCPVLIAIVLATALTVPTQASQEQLAQSIKDTQLETMRTSDQLKATVRSLNLLTSQKKGDLKPAYKAYCDEVAKTSTAYDWTRARVQWMGGDGRKYFQDWQGTVSSITNPSLRKKAQKRLDAARDGYDHVEAALKEASDEFKPFVSDLADIQKALAADVTPGGVKAIRSVVSSANKNHKAVNESINKAIRELDKMAKALSSRAG